MHLFLGQEHLRATMQAMLHRQSEEIQSLVQENQRILEELAYLRLQILSAANHQ